MLGVYDAYPSVKELGQSIGAAGWCVRKEIKRLAEEVDSHLLLAAFFLLAILSDSVCRVFFSILGPRDPGDG